MSVLKCYSPSIWVTSFSIFCYKTCKLGSYEGSKTKKFFNKALSVCEYVGDQEKHTSSIRVDVHARKISLYTSYIHCLLGNEDVDVSRDLLAEFFNEFDLSNAWRNDYNFCRLLAFNLVLSADPSIDFYIYISRDILNHRGKRLSRLPPTQLKEFSETLLILSIILRVAEGEDINWNDRLSLFKSSSRVKDVGYINKVKNKLKRFDQW